MEGWLDGCSFTTRVGSTPRPSPRDERHAQVLGWSVVVRLLGSDDRLQRNCALGMVRETAGSALGAPGHHFGARA
jgi:hypothetical protein